MWLLFAGIEIPEIPGVEGAKGDGLSGIDGRTATDGEDKIDLIIAGYRKGIIYTLSSRIGLDATIFDEANSRSGQRTLDLVEEAGVADTIRAIDDHHHSGAARSQGEADLLLRAAAENKLSR